MATIQKIQFINKALVTYVDENEITQTCEVDVDCRSQTVVNAPPEIANLFFPFLNESLNMAANEFEAEADLYESASKAAAELDKAHEDHVGGECAG